MPKSTLLFSVFSRDPKEKFVLVQDDFGETWADFDGKKVLVRTVPVKEYAIAAAWDKPRPIRGLMLYDDIGLPETLVVFEKL